MALHYLTAQLLADDESLSEVLADVDLQAAKIPTHRYHPSFGASPWPAWRERAAEARSRIADLARAIRRLDRAMQSAEHRQGEQWLHDMAIGAASVQLATGSICRNAEANIARRAVLVRRLDRAITLATTGGRKS